MYVATASPRPKRTAFDGSRGGMCPVFPPLGSATVQHIKIALNTNNKDRLLIGQT